MKLDKTRIENPKTIVMDVFKIAIPTVLVANDLAYGCNF